MVSARPVFRSETRNERYDKKSANAESLDIIPVCINFMFEENVAFVVRSAACFGARTVGVIGQVPSRGLLKSRSGGLSDRMNILPFKNTNEFMNYVRQTDGYMVAAEMTDGSVDITKYQFPAGRTIWLVLGHEEIGVPEEILLSADAVVHIPMPGVGFCLNVSQSATVIMYEYMKQMKTD